MIARYLFVFVVVITAHYSELTRVQLTANITAPHGAQILPRPLFIAYGILDKLLADDGVQFVAKSSRYFRDFSENESSRYGLPPALNPTS